MALTSLRQELKKNANKNKAKLLRRFFKTGPGEYGEGDVFMGITVPTLRTLSKKYQNLSLSDTRCLLKSPFHEKRLLALFILILKYQKGDEALRKNIYTLYLKSTRYINNWDLVDLSAHKIVGEFLSDKDKKTIYDLARSSSLWDRRIAILATFQFIKNNRYTDSLRIAQILLNDKEDLIHKAVGWMLREIGKRNLQTEESFLKKHYKQMPRTMLRYAIERFEENKRKAYLKK